MSIPSSISTALEISRDDGYLLSTDRTKLDLNIICEWISTDCYWAIGRSHEVICGSIEHSLPFGLYTLESGSSSGDILSNSRENDSWKQIAFARVVTDYCIHILFLLHPLTHSLVITSCPTFVFGDTSVLTGLNS
jgi:hypothetical protein